MFYTEHIEFFSNISGYLIISLFPPETIQTTFFPFKSFIESKPQMLKQPAGSTIIPSS